MIPDSISRWGIAILSFYTVFCTLSTLAIILRLWSRRIRNTPFAINDYAVVLALFFSYCLLADGTIMVLRGGLGHHQPNVSARQTTILLKAFPAGAVLWACSNTAVKGSILHLYICIFPVQRFRMAAYGTAALTATYIITIMLETLLICRPFAYFWDKSIRGTCGNQVVTYLTAGIFNLLIDIIIVVLPMPMLWGLQLPWAKKLGLTGIFGIGAAICIITILRIKAVYDLDLTDLTFSIAPMGIYTILEPTLGIINACLPVIQPALQKLSQSAKLNRSRGATKCGHAGSGDRSRQHHRSGSKAKRFQRLDDRTFPPNDIYGHVNELATLECGIDLKADDVGRQARRQNCDQPGKFDLC